VATHSYFTEMNYSRFAIKDDSGMLYVLPIKLNGTVLYKLYCCLAIRITAAVQSTSSLPTPASSRSSAGEG